MARGAIVEFDIRGGKSRIFLENVHEGESAIGCFRRHTGRVDFDSPTVLNVNGLWRLRKDWTKPLKETDQFAFMSFPASFGSSSATSTMTISGSQGSTTGAVSAGGGASGGLMGLLGFVGIIFAIISVVLTLVMKPKAPQVNQAQSEPVHSLNAAGNAARLTEPIEVVYGKRRVYPSKGAFDYFEYKDNDQFGHFYLVVGMGRYEIDPTSIKIGDTAISSFDEVETQIVGPAGDVTLFPVNVATSTDITNQEIFAPNNDDYSASDPYVGPFPVNDAGTEATEVRFDLVFPRGLYEIGNTGKFWKKIVHIEVTIREIDAAGNPVSGATWEVIQAGKRVEVFTSTKQTRTRSGVAYDEWVWAKSSITRSTNAADDPIGVTTTYSDGGDDDPTDRAGVTKTVTTILTGMGEDYLIVEARSQEVQRRTFSEPLMPGRYQIRMQRVNNEKKTLSVGHKANWEGLRATIVQEEDVGATTRLAVKIRASNNLDADTSNQFNVVAERLVPVRNQTTGVYTLQKTRSIVWAFVDVFRAEYGPQLDDSFFDWDTLYALDAIFTSRGWNFDYTFRDPTTAWEAAVIIARAGRAVPVYSGPKISMILDQASQNPVYAFNMENIIAGTFQWSTSYPEVDENDSLEIEYVEESTGFLPEVLTITSSLNSGTSTKVKSERLVGVQDRTHAYRIGRYLLERQLRIRTGVQFSTGMEGFIPSIGDTIQISVPEFSDTANWGTGGFVVKADESSGGLLTLWLSREVSFDAVSGTTYQITLQLQNGDILGPMTCYQTSEPDQVEAELPSGESTVSVVFNGQVEPVFFNFGPSTDAPRNFRVVQVVPQEGEVVDIVCENVDPLIFDGDDETPAALSHSPTPTKPGDFPTVSSVTVQQIAGNELTVSVYWPPALGARFYVVQYSRDSGVSWSTDITTTQTSIILQASIETFTVRVAAVNKGRGAFTSGSVSVSPIALVEETVAFEDSSSLEITWWRASNPHNYQIEVSDNSGSAPVLLTTDTVAQNVVSYTWANADAAAHGRHRELLLSVDARIRDEDDVTVFAASGVPKEIAVSNSIPGQPTGLSATLVAAPGSGETAVEYDIEWTNPADNDLTRYKIWVSEVNGFDEDGTGENPPDVSEEPTGGLTASATETHRITVALDTAQTHVAQYVKVGVFDPWGDETTTNISAQLTIPAIV